MLNGARAARRSNADLVAFFVECKLELATGLEFEGAQEFDRYAHLSNLGQDSRAVPHHLVSVHVPRLTN